MTNEELMMNLTESLSKLVKNRMGERVVTSYTTEKS